jgi:hypothetical protein
MFVTRPLVYIAVPSKPLRLPAEGGGPSSLKALDDENPAPPQSGESNPDEPVRSAPSDDVKSEGEEANPNPALSAISELVDADDLMALTTVDEPMDEEGLVKE